MKSGLIVAAAALLALAGCAHETQPVGGSVGAISGSGAPAGGGGSLRVGATAGDEARALVDQQMNEKDRMHMLQVLEFNRAGAASSWTNTASNKAYTITPEESYNSGQGVCRDFSATVNAAGNLEQSQGTACRLPNGGWEVTK